MSKNAAKPTGEIVAINGGAGFSAGDQSVFEILGRNAANGLNAEAAALGEALRTACGDPDRFGFRTIKLPTYYGLACDAWKGGYVHIYYAARGIDAANVSAEDEKKALRAAAQAWSSRLEMAKINPPSGGRGRPKTQAGSGATERKAAKRAAEKAPAANLTKAQKALADKVTAMRKILNHSEKAGIKCATAVHKAMSDALTAYNKTLK